MPTEIDKREVIARRVAQELRDGYYVNVGIGLPTLIPNYLPPSLYGKATTFFEITMIFLVLVLALQDNHALYMLKEICGYCVAVFVCISGVHYSIVVSRRLHTGG